MHARLSTRNCLHFTWWSHLESNGEGDGNEKSGREQTWILKNLTTNHPTMSNTVTIKFQLCSVQIHMKHWAFSVVSWIKTFGYFCWIHIQEYNIIYIIPIHSTHFNQLPLVRKTIFTEVNKPRLTLDVMLQTKLNETFFNELKTGHINQIIISKLQRTQLYLPSFFIRWSVFEYFLAMKNVLLIFPFIVTSKIISPYLISYENILSIDTIPSHINQ